MAAAPLVPLARRVKDSRFEADEADDEEAAEEEPGLVIVVMDVVESVFRSLCREWE